MSKFKSEWLNRYKPPHCDPAVLHAPTKCEFCDTLPDLQLAREMWRINFTGEKDPDKSPCPSEHKRPLDKVHAWPGNRPAPKESPRREIGEIVPLPTSYQSWELDKLLSDVREEAIREAAKNFGEHHELPYQTVEPRKGIRLPMPELPWDGMASTCSAIHEVPQHKVTLSGNPADTFYRGGAPQPIEPETGMHGDYWVLSPEERAKGFVRPLRTTYRHVGERPKFKARPLWPEEIERYRDLDYVCYEAYERDDSSVVGRFWTEKQLVSGCGATTTMNIAIAETYARQPDFYSSTFCARCKAHFPVGEFIWDGSDKRVGT